MNNSNSVTQDQTMPTTPIGESRFELQAKAPGFELEPIQPPQGRSEGSDLPRPVTVPSLSIVGGETADAASNPTNKRLVKLAPFELKVPGGGWIQIGVGSPGVDRHQKPRPPRYYFKHPTEREPSGRARRIYRQSKDEITQVALQAYADALANNVTLSRADYAALLDFRKRVEWAENQLQGTVLSLELLVGQTLPTMRLITGEQITLAQVLEAGRSFFVPATPMTFDQVLTGLVPLILANATPSHADGIKANCEYLLQRFAGRLVHQVSAQDLEQLVLDVEEGKFLSEDEKKKSLARNKWVKPPLKDGREKWYRDNTLVHCYNAWRRLFIRAKKIGAWPLLKPLPTEIMERPRADAVELDALPAEDWTLLLPALNKEQLRLVAMILADIRLDEIGRLSPKHIVCENGIPVRINLPAPYAKGRKGDKKGRSITLVPYISVLLYLAGIPEGDQLFENDVSDIMSAIYEIARELGIETNRNCLRKMHDTYWYGLLNTRTAQNADSSHSKEMIDTVYREVASFEDSYAVYTTFRKETPEALRVWVLEWADGFRRKFRGGQVPRLNTLAGDEGDGGDLDDDGEGVAAQDSQVTPGGQLDDALSETSSPPAIAGPPLPPTEVVTRAPEARPPARKRGGAKTRIAWPSSKADFLVELWNSPATHIGARLRCSQAAVLGKALEWELPRPGHGYFQRKNFHKPVEWSEEAKERLAQLRAEEAAARQAAEESAAPAPPNDNGMPATQMAEVPLDEEDSPVAEPTASVSTEDTPSAPPPIAAEEVATADPSPAIRTTSAGDGTTGQNGPSAQSSPARKSRFRTQWPAKASFLEMLWQMPATKIGKLLGVSNVAVAKRAKALDLQIPDPSYRTTIARGGKLEIPEHIQQKLALLRCEEGIAIKEFPAPVVPGTANPALSAASKSQEAPATGLPTAGSGTGGPSQPPADFIVFRPSPQNPVSHTSTKGDYLPTLSPNIKQT